MDAVGARGSDACAPDGGRHRPCVMGARGRIGPVVGAHREPPPERCDGVAQRREQLRVEALER
ncbi:MAG: hypothetical protein QOD44_4085, partial [Solirubrobacteraceae bacterium]|nr:hypothetical protein [Solirubrobacteraceae bacterium]